MSPSPPEPNARIPFWEKRKRSNAVNLIAAQEIEYLKYRAPDDDWHLRLLSQKEKDLRHVFYKVNAIFSNHPEECLLSWLCLWKAKNHKEASQVALLAKRGRTICVVRGTFIYFTKLPKGEPDQWTDAQREAWQKYLRNRQPTAGRPRGSEMAASKVWHCDRGHEWLAAERMTHCPHMNQGNPCSGLVLAGPAPGSNLVVANKPSGRVVRRG